MTDQEIGPLDVIVIGAGNAALSAAVAAAEAGAEVVVLEKAPQELRGGNTCFTGDMRFPWKAVQDLFPLVPNIARDEMDGMREHARPYSEADFYDDIMRVTNGRSDPELLEVLVTESFPTIQWMAEKGHSWVPSYANPVASMPLALNGGGAQLSDRWFAIASDAGVHVLYGHQAVELIQAKSGVLEGVRVLTADGYRIVHGKTVILGSGGFEANAAMRASYLGRGWDTVKVRGVPFNSGDGLRMAMDLGAWPYGQWSGCHATPQDYDRPAYSVRVGPSAGEFNRYAYPFSVMVNGDGRRFIDEGQDRRTYTYVKMGAAILQQPGGVAYQIFDSKCEKFLTAYKKATGGSARSLAELAELLEIDPQGLIRTIDEYNAAVQPGDFDPYRLDGKGTSGLNPPKSNWAMPIDEPPFYGYAVVCGITFTFGGLRVNRQAQVMHTSDRPIPGLFACGEIVGGFFYDNYAGGSGLTQGATFGRIAGHAAARQAFGVE